MVEITQLAQPILKTVQRFEKALAGEGLSPADRKLLQDLVRCGRSMLAAIDRWLETN